MKKTTLCYIEKDDKYLMLYRNKKADDPNEGKWIGVGGKLEQGETPEICVRREVLEETALAPKEFIFRGIVHFISDEWEDEDMYLYTAQGVDVSTDEDIPCDEGTLKWISKSDVLSLNLWEGDRYFLELIAKESPCFEMRLEYQGEKLVSSQIIMDKGIEKGNYE